MQKMSGRLAVLIMLLALMSLNSEEGRVVLLGWEEVAGITLTENLSLKMSFLELQSQEAEVKKAWGSFLPSIDYQWIWRDDESTQSQMPYPLDNAFIHSLNMTYPIFTGGVRYANLRMQQELRKSMRSELRGAESVVVEQSLQAYFGVILAESLVEVNQEALDLIERNLSQVESFREAGTATELEVMQVRTRYFEILPQLESARNQRQLALNQLKLILNLESADSLQIVDELQEQQLLGGYSGLSLEEYKILASENRAEVSSVQAKSIAIGQQKLMAESQFLPSVALTASRSFYAYSDEFWIDRGEFEAYNSVGLAVQLPLFSGGSRWNDLKQAVYSQKKLAVMEELTIDQVQLEAEQAYYQYVKSRDNLKSYKEALRAAEESLRLADLYYQEGLSTQTEILNAQLAYTQNNLALKSGIYEYNTSQIALLRAIGDLERIWQE